MSTPLTILHGGHRKVIRIGANDNMSTLLLMACKEFGLDAGSPLVLKHKRNVVDLSQPFRFTGIPQNATLEIEEGRAAGRRGDGAKTDSSAAGGQKHEWGCEDAVAYGMDAIKGGRGIEAARRDFKVRVAMKLPGGGRVQASFPSETTLAGLLRLWADAREIDPGVLHKGPSLQFMRRAYGEGELESTTLRSIGLSTGSAMFTLSLSSPSASSSGVLADVPAGAQMGSATLSAPSLSAQQQEQDELDRAIALSASMASASSPPGDASNAVPANAPTAATTMNYAADGASTINRKDTAAVLPAMEGSGGPQSGMPPPPGGAGSTLMPIATTEIAGSGFPSSKGVSVSGSAVAAGPDAMEVVGDGTSSAAGQSAEAKKPARPSIGVSVCRAALEAMASGHFDADSSACVITLAKIVDNVVHRPDDARTRQIRCANSTFHQKVGRIQGGIEFLEGVGFTPKDEEPGAPLFGIGSGGQGGGGGGRMLVLPSDREDHGLLREARALLEKQAEALGVPREKMPQPPRPVRAPSTLGAGETSQGAAAAFDPYKPFISSTAPTPKGQEEQSLTEKRLKALMVKRDGLVAGGVPERNVQVTLPSRVAASTRATLLGGGTGGTDSGGLSAMEGVTSKDSALDRSLIAKKVSRQMAERKKMEDTPFQTKAMREIERLQKATVYRTTLVKVQFPDRVVLQATFASTEGVRNLVELVRESLEVSQRERKFELYVSPPRMVLKETSSLSQAGLVPAALVYVSWKNVPPPGEAEGAYLKAELLSAGGGGSVVRPVGVSLEGGEGGSEESKFGGASRAGGSRTGTGSRGSRSGGGGKKPGWLKIN